jgi:hypothetical protein
MKETFSILYAPFPQALYIVVLCCQFQHPSVPTIVLFTAPACTIIIIALESCALNAEFLDLGKFHYFVDFIQRGDKG